MPIDSAGHDYFDIGNIRITCIPKTWDKGKPGLRIQAYEGKGNRVMPGAEIPIPDKATAYDFIRAVSDALKANGL